MVVPVDAASFSFGGGCESNAKSSNGAECSGEESSSEFFHDGV